MSNLNFPTADLLFDPEEHKYYYNGNILRSVTSLLRSTLFADKYGDVSESVLRKAAAFGTSVHRLLEMGDNLSPRDVENVYEDCFGSPNITEESRVAVNAILDVYHAAQGLLWHNNVNPLQKEYLVTDGRLAGSVDLIADVSGVPSIVDYKFTYEFDTEYLSWQMSIYAYLFYKQTGQRIEKIYALWVPKRDVSLGKFTELPMKSDEDIEALITGELTNKSESYPVDVREAQAALANVLLEEKRIAEQKKQLQATLHKFMEENGVKQIKSDFYTISYIAPSTRKSLDAKALAADHPEIDLSQYQKESKTSSTVKITLAK